jgi:hypothetical protein
MLPHEAESFRDLLAGVYGFYGKDLSEFPLSVWWGAMKPYDIASVKDALGRHAVNPDTGQFLPKPADVIRMLQGTTVDSAMVAWSKVDKAAREIGPYQDVVFDDPVIHRVLHDMNGWIAIGSKTDAEWPFIAREFETRYRGYRMRGDSPAYAPVLIGIAGADIRKAGRPLPVPVMVGDRNRCAAVMSGGTDDRLLEFTRPAEAMPQRLTSTAQDAA